MILIAQDLSTGSAPGRMRALAIERFGEIFAAALKTRIEAVYVDSTVLDIGRMTEKDGVFPKTHKYVLLHGYPPERILAHARKRGKTAEMLVLGTHGRTGISRLILGSVAEEVIRNATLPTVTIGPEVQNKPLPLATAGIRRVLFATDLGPACERAKKHTLMLAKKLGCEVTVIHSLFADMHPVIQTAMSSPTGEKRLATFMKTYGEKQKKSLDQLIKGFSKKGIVCRGVLDDSTAPISETVVKHASGSDLIIMGTRSRNRLSKTFLGSTARAVILTAPVPVMTLASRA